MGHVQHSRRLYEALESIRVKDRPSLRRRVQWYYGIHNEIDPIFAHVMDDSEIQMLADWFRDTNDAPFLGETGFQGISFLSSLILTNGIRNIVQLGHYAGFSSLIMGCMLRKISSEARLISFDIDSKMTDYCENWTRKAGLQSIVHHVCADSTDPATVGMAGAHLAGNPDLLFIDASKQYGNTIAEVRMWSPYLHGFIVAHDVSDVAKGDQANGRLGVSDALSDSGSFKPNELLLLDPQSDRRRGFPYLDPMGLGIGIARGAEALPRSADPITPRILEAEKLRAPENWNLQQGFTLEGGTLVKDHAYAAFATCYAPIRAGQTLAFELNIGRTNGGGVVICGGGNPGTSAVVQGQGRHSGEFVVGDENSLLAVYGPVGSQFEIDHIRMFVP